MLSLHNEPSQLIITCITDMKPIKVVPIGFEARSINFEYKLNQIYLISIFDELDEINNDMIVIDIGYKKMKLVKGNLTMRF